METLDQMANEVIEFLKKKNMWYDGVIIHCNGKRYSVDGIEPSEKKINEGSFMFMVFEGRLNYAINHGLHDPNYSIFKGLEKILDKYGYYPEFWDHCSLNAYK